MCNMRSKSAERVEGRNMLENGKNDGGLQFGADRGSASQQSKRDLHGSLQKNRWGWEEESNIRHSGYTHCGMAGGLLLVFSWI